MASTQRSPARLLAPIALVAFGVALFVIVASGGGGEGGKSQSAARQEQRDLGVQRGEKRRRQQARREDKLPQGVYVVKSGDTLGSISAKTGIPVEKLQELNPQIDPQQLTSGQKIKLRE